MLLAKSSTKRLQSGTTCLLAHLSTSAKPLVWIAQSGRSLQMNYTQSWNDTNKERNQCHMAKRKADIVRPPGPPQVQRALRQLAKERASIDTGVPVNQIKKGAKPIAGRATNKKKGKSK
jgi:hypothetical protein